MDVNVDKTLDCQGLSCPMPILKLAKEIKGMEGGQVLELLGTDPGSKTDVPGWCKKTGNEFLGLEEDGGVYKFYVRKS
jgi:tRNA 2-thiouridine synthesizing protein A